LSTLSRKVLQSAVASGTSNPPTWRRTSDFRVFQLSPQEAPSVWSDASKPSSGRWNCRKWRLPRHFWVLLHAVKRDMGQAALPALRRKAYWGFFRPKNPTASAGFEPAKLGTKGQHATSRPPKPLSHRITIHNCLPQYGWSVRSHYEGRFLIFLFSFLSFLTRHIPVTGRRWRWVVSFTPRLLYLPSGTHCIEGWMAWRFGVERDLLPFAGFEPRFFDAVRGLVIAPISLHLCDTNIYSERPGVD
jgi:hypothetical protein